jgi:hypothetical protein
LLNPSFLLVLFCLYLLTLTGDRRLHLQQKKHVFCGWSWKILQEKVTCNTRSKVEAEKRGISKRNSTSKIERRSTSSPLILGRSFLKQRGGHVRRQWREECIQVNHDLGYATWFKLNTFYLIIASEGRSQGRMKQRRHKSCCIRQDKNQRPPVKTKKMTKPKNKSTPKPRMV